MLESGIDVAFVTDDDSVYYYTGYYDYLHMEFGRPTILIVPANDESLLITPSIDLNTARATANVDRIEAWNDGTGSEWREHIPDALKGKSKIAFEPHQMPAIVREYVNQLVNADQLIDVLVRRGRQASGQQIAA